MATTQCLGVGFLQPLEYQLWAWYWFKTPRLLWYGVQKKTHWNCGHRFSFQTVSPVGCFLMPNEPRLIYFLFLLLWFNLVAIKYQEFNIQTLSTRRGNTSTQSWTRCIRSTRVRSMWKLWGIWKRLASTALSSFHSWRTFQLF